MRYNNFSNVPILSTMETYRIRKFEQHHSLRGSRRAQTSRSLATPLTMIDTSSCGLCQAEFKSLDVVLDCVAGHIFHLTCFEQ